MGPVPFGHHRPGQARVAEMGGQVREAMGHEGAGEHELLQDLGLGRFSPDHQVGQERGEENHPPVPQVDKFDFFSRLYGQGPENQVAGGQIRVAAAQFS
jgi:hypothetical protein